MRSSSLFYYRIFLLLNRILWPFILPVLFCVWAFSPRSRPHFLERLGLSSFSSRYPETMEGSSGKILFHVASLGEANAATPLIRKLSESFPLVLTATTVTGREALKKNFPSLPVSLAPIDLPDLWIPFLKSRQIQKILLFETEIWPSMLLCAMRLGIPAGIVNARLSTRGFRRMNRFRFLFSRLFGSLKTVVVQSGEDLERFRTLGVPKQDVHLAGNLKWDIPDPLKGGTDSSLLSEWVQRAEKIWGSENRRPFRLLLSSIHPEETKRILTAIEKGVPYPLFLHVLIAPRHLERLPEFRSFLPKSLLVQDRHDFFFMDEKNVLHGHLFLSLLDTYGELRALTVLADLVVVGGTFDPVGGHSPIDAAAAGIPLVSGPNVDHIREVVQDLSDGGGMIQLPGPDLLSALLLELMKSPEKREKMGQKNREVFAAQRGALQRTMELLKPFLEEMSPPPKRTDL